MESFYRLLIIVSPKTEIGTVACRTLDKVINPHVIMFILVATTKI